MDLRLLVVAAALAISVSAGAAPVLAPPAAPGPEVQPHISTVPAR